MRDANRQLVRLFEEDPDLGRWLDDRTAALARRDVVVDAVVLRRGQWEPRRLAPASGPPPTALIVLDGFLSREIGVHGRRGIELYGPGDVTHPWGTSERDGCPGADEAWRVLHPARLAVLDRRFEATAARLPGVMSELMGRHGRQSRSVATHRAVLQVPGLANRLHLTLWCLADRWGRVSPDGVVLPLRLSHGMLGDLVGATRPAVTLALRALLNAGAVARRAEGQWVLRGEPPRFSPALEPRQVPEAAAAGTR